jgi:hypothetical protein
MKKIPYVADVLLKSTRGAQFVAPDANGNQVPLSASQRNMFLEACEFPQLTEGKHPASLAARYVRAVVEAIVTQTEDIVQARGFWLFEDDHAASLIKAVMAGAPPTQANPRGGPPAQTLHCMLEFYEACEKAEKYVAELKSMNGAEKALPEAAQAS